MFLIIQENDQKNQLKTVFDQNLGSLNQLGFNDANNLESLNATGVLRVHIFNCISGFVLFCFYGVLATD